jgi:hypothetical protein
MEEKFINIDRNKLIFAPCEINSGWTPCNIWLRNFFSEENIAPPPLKVKLSFPKRVYLFLKINHVLQTFIKY